MSEKRNWEPDSAQTKDLLKVNIVDEMAPVLKQIDGKLSPELMDPLDWVIRAIETRLSIAEGNISILHQSHLGHTNFSSAEFEQMHGYRPAEKKDEFGEPLGKRATKLAMMLAIDLQQLHDSEEDGYHLGEAIIESLSAIFNMEVACK